MYSALDIAKYLLSLTDANEGELISHLKLQKLLYYSQGLYLVLKDEPLFAEEIIAWQHGPVVRDVYDTYKEYGSCNIPIPKDINFDKYDEEVAEFLQEIYTAFGQFSAWKLRDMTHSEDSWKEAFSHGRKAINLDLLKETHKQYLSNDEERSS